MSFAEFLSENAPVLLLAGAAAGWYAASFAAAEALAGRRLALRRRVVGQWIPILAMALVATLTQQTEVAVGVLFASSVAALSLVLGIVTLSAELSPRPSEPGGFPVIETPNAHVVAVVSPDEPPSRLRRLWAFVLPAALIALLAGFSGRFTGFHAILLALEGLVLLTLWTAPNELDEIDRAAVNAPDAGRSNGPLAAVMHPSDMTEGAIRVPHRSRGTVRRGTEVALAVVVALLASWAGARATHDVSRGIGLVSGGFVAAMLVAPALVLPMIGSGMALARARLHSAAVTASVGIVLLNLCFGLPLVIGVWYAKPLWDGRLEHLNAMVTPTQAKADAPATTSPAADAALDADAAARDPSIRYPIAVWRVDTVILILLGLVLLPLAVGRWMPGKFEGVLLVFVYMIYMGLTTWAARA